MPSDSCLRVLCNKRTQCVNPVFYYAQQILWYVFLCARIFADYIIKRAFSRYQKRKKKDLFETKRHNTHALTHARLRVTKDRWHFCYGTFIQKLTCFHHILYIFIVPEVDARNFNAKNFKQKSLHDDETHVPDDVFATVLRRRTWLLANAPLG